MSMDELEEIMMRATDTEETVHVICTDGDEYTGKASHFASGVDEEDGFATFCVDDPRCPMCLGVNEITSIEYVT